MSTDNHRAAQGHTSKQIMATECGIFLELYGGVGCGTCCKQFPGSFRDNNKYVPIVSSVRIRLEQSHSIAQHSSAQEDISG